MKSTRNGFLFLAGGAIVGAVSATLAIDIAGSAPASGGSAWRVWERTSAADADPYALAHFLLQGNLPPPAPLVAQYYRARDDDGERLSTNCTYELAGPSPDARWWGITAGSGGLSGQATSAETVVDPSGRLRIRLSRYPQTENWLELPDAGSFDLKFTVAGTGTGDPPAPRFSLSRIEC
jgi:hypothetical protein